MVSSSQRRVVITGLGQISPLGNTIESFQTALSEERSGVGPIESIPTEHLPVKNGAEASEFTGHISDFGDLPKAAKRAIRKGLKVMCREIQMGVAVAQLALADAGLGEEDRDPDRTGVVYGSDYMMTLPGEFTDGVRACLDSEGKFDFDQWAEKGLPQVTPLWLLKYLPNMPASHIAIYNDLRGPNNSITVREASGNLAIGEACATIKRGSADIIVAGATGTRVHPMRSVHTILQEELASDLDDPARMSRPFDQSRDGAVMGEGAGAILLEELETAQRRGVKILGEVVGSGSSAVASRRGVADSRSALRNAMTAALRSANMRPEQIGHIHAHGLGTVKGDLEEGAAIGDVFGEQASRTPVTAAKSYFGNLGAGSGLVELISSVLAIGEGTLFPVLNCDSPDPKCGVRVAQTGDSAGDSVLKLSVSPQGQASALVVRKFA